MIIVQSRMRTHLGILLLLHTHTHTRKEDFISLLPKVKVYPKCRIFDRFFMTVFNNLCYYLGKS